MRIILFTLLFFVFSCGQEKTTTVIPHVDVAGEGGQGCVNCRWEKSRFPLVIRVPLSTPCLLNPSNPADNTIPSLINCGSTDLETMDENTQALMDVLTNSISAWNNALDFTALQLQFVGSNVVLNSPADYVPGPGNTENTLKRLAWIPNWFEGAPRSEQPGDDVLAVTVYTYVDSTDLLQDADLLFNIKRFNFTTLPRKNYYQNTLCPSKSNATACADAKVCNWAGNSCVIKPEYSGNIDLQSVLTHELGHFLGLQHVSTTTDSSSIMNPSLTSETQKILLSSQDKCRINQRYRNIFSTCNMTTAQNKFCYDTTQVASVGVVGGECHITACNPGFTLNSMKTACISE